MFNIRKQKTYFKAKMGGADAAKFQTYKAELITSKNSPSYWDTTKEKTKVSLNFFKKYDHFKKATTLNFINIAKV